MPSSEMQNIMNAMRQYRPAEQPPIPQARENFERLATLFPTPEDIDTERVDADGVPGEWIVPPDVPAGRVLYYLHGGGYIVGSVSTHRHMIAAIARAAGVRAFAIDYRLAPEHPHPAAVDDARTAYRWLLGQGVDPSRIAIAGDSAGGGLTLATLVALRDAGDRLPACAVTLSPWTDVEGTGESVRTRKDADPMIDGMLLGDYGKLYAADEDPKTPTISPLHADLSGLPPILVHVGDAEVLLSDSTRIAEKLRDAGVEVTLDVWDEMPHVWHFFHVAAPESKDAIEKIAAFMGEYLA